MHDTIFMLIWIDTHFIILCKFATQKNYCNKFSQHVITFTRFFVRKFAVRHVTSVFLWVEHKFGQFELIYDDLFTIRTAICILHVATTNRSEISCLLLLKISYRMVFSENFIDHVCLRRNRKKYGRIKHSKCQR